MPTISRFYGIVIRMYFQQHEHHLPHIHAIYGEDVASININTLEVIEGDLPPVAMRLTTKWIAHNRDQLLEMWKTQQFINIDPLE